MSNTWILYFSSQSYVITWNTFFISKILKKLKLLSKIFENLLALGARAVPCLEESPTAPCAHSQGVRAAVLGTLAITPWHLRHSNTKMRFEDESLKDFNLLTEFMKKMQRKKWKLRSIWREGYKLCFPWKPASLPTGYCCWAGMGMKSLTWETAGL